MIIAALGLALVGSNLYWAYRYIDLGATHSYVDQQRYEDSRALAAAIAMLPVAARTNSTRDEVVKSATTNDGAEPFDKDGLTWVQGLGLQFDGSGRLVAVRRD